MKPSFDTRLLCRCSECDTVFRLVATQLARRAGLVRCGDCGTVFNAAWNLVDTIPNPVESSTPVTPISSTRLDRDNIVVKTNENENSDPRIAIDERLFSLDDQLRQDLQLGADDPNALEEIRRALGPTDVAIQPEERRPRSKHLTWQVQQKNTAHPTDSEPWFVEPTHLNSEVRPSANRQLAGKSSPTRQVKTQGLWLLATLVVAVSLFMQARYWLFDELSAIPSARAPLESFCRLVGCSVPAPLRGATFQVLETQINLDPQRPDAVIIKLYLENRTTIPRLYPAIQLVLTNREGKTIGKRTYTARDYGTSTKTDKLPPGVEAIVTLHLASPGEFDGFEARVVETGT